MSSKEELVTIIKEWIETDDKVKELQAILKDYKTKKKTLTMSLLGIMKNNEIDCFDINGGSLVYKKNKVKKPINAKTLMSTLKNYFASNPVQAEEVTKFVMENREEQVKETIKRKIDK